MNTNKSGLMRKVTVVGGIPFVAMLVTPATAYAAGAEILLPKPAEFIPALIAFLVIWLILAKLAWPMIIKTLDAREEKIAGDLQAAADAREKAEESVRSCADRVTAAEREAQDIIAAAKREGEEERTRIIAEAQASAVGIVAKAHESVEEERKKAMVVLSSQVVDLSVEIASKIIGDALGEEEQLRLAEQYLMEVGNLND